MKSFDYDVQTTLKNIVIKRESEELDALDDDLEFELSDTILLMSDIEDEQDESNNSGNKEEEYFSSSLPSLKLSELSKTEIESVKISPNSKFSDEIWNLCSANQEINFSFKKGKYKSEEINRFAKFFLYYVIPENHPTGKIKSLYTASGYQSIFQVLVTMLFDEYAITAPCRDITVLTLEQLNKAFDKAKNTSYSKYASLYYAISHWFNLSEYGLLPDEYNIPCERGHLLTRERRSDVFNSIQTESVGWKPFNDDELVKLVDYITIQLDVVQDKLLSIVQLAQERGISKLQQSQEVLLVVSEIHELTSTNTCLARNSLRQKLIQKKYLYVREVIKNFRAALYALLALITGARRRELSAIKFSDFEAISNGMCKLTLTRWKTSDDPSSHGTKSDIYLPIGVFHAADTLQKVTAQFYGKVPESLAYHLTYADEQIKTGVTSIFTDLSAKLDINLHPHRFRKTIASLLITQNEKNIELIRFLFGHKSYAMTMHYIMRNPLLVDEIAGLLERHSCDQFTNVISAVMSGNYSGVAADQIARNIKKKPDIFSGEVLHTTVKEYVSAMLKAGEPIFIHRIPLGGTCISVPVLASNPTPCTRKLDYVDRVMPDVSMCESEMCPKAVFTKESLPSLEQNIKFYEDLLNRNEHELSDALVQKYERLLQVTRAHIEKIRSSRPLFPDVEGIKYV